MHTDTLALAGRIHLILRGPDGKIKQEIEKDNLIVQVGKNFLANAVVLTSSSPFTHMAVGTSGTAPANGDTTLGAEVARQAFSQGVAANVVTMSTTYAAGVGTGALQEAGLLNNSSGGTLLSHVTYAVVNKGALDTLTISWAITVG